MRYFIFTLLLVGLTSGLSAEPLTEDQQQQAWRLFTSLGCRACHSVNDNGSNLAGSLGRIGLKLDEEAILNRLRMPPKNIQPGEKFMPSYQTTPLNQLELLSRYLANFK